MCNGGGGGVWVSGPPTEKHLLQIPWTGQFFLMTTFCIAFYESHLSTGLTYLKISHYVTFISSECCRSGSTSFGKLVSVPNQSQEPDTDLDTHQTQISGAVEAQNRAIAYGEEWTLTIEEWSSK